MQLGQCTCKTVVRGEKKRLVRYLLDKSTRRVRGSIIKLIEETRPRIGLYQPVVEFGITGVAIGPHTEHSTHNDSNDDHNSTDCGGDPLC